MPAKTCTPAKIGDTKVRYGRQGGKGGLSEHAHGAGDVDGQAIIIKDIAEFSLFSRLINASYLERSRLFAMYTITPAKLVDTEPPRQFEFARSWVS